MLFQSERILPLFYLLELVSVLESRLKVFSFCQSFQHKHYALVMQHLLLENLTPTSSYLSDTT